MSAGVSKRCIYCEREAGDADPRTPNRPTKITKEHVLKQAWASELPDLVRRGIISNSAGVSGRRTGVRAFAGVTFDQSVRVVCAACNSDSATLVEAPVEQFILNAARSGPPEGYDHDVMEALGVWAAKTCAVESAGKRGTEHVPELALNEVRAAMGLPVSDAGVPDTLTWLAPADTLGPVLYEASGENFYVFLCGLGKVAIVSVGTSDSDMVTELWSLVLDNFPNPVSERTMAPWVQSMRKSMRH